MTALATGVDIVNIVSGGFGFLDSSSTFSLPMIPIDAEIVAMARRMVKGIDISVETLMPEAIERVGIGGNFLKEKATRVRIRAGEHFQPSIVSRLPFGQWMSEGRSEFDEATEKIQVVLAARAERGPHLTADQRSELTTICGVPLTQAEIA